LSGHESDHPAGAAWGEVHGDRRAAFLPGELVATADQPGGSQVSLPLVWGVCWACGRVGSVVGLIFFIIRRTLMGEVADPRGASVAEAPAIPADGDILATR